MAHQLYDIIDLFGDNMTEQKQQTYTACLTLLTKRAGETIIAKLVSMGYSINNSLGSPFVELEDNAAIMLVISLANKEKNVATIIDDINTICNDNKLKFYSANVYENSGAAAFQLGNMVLPKVKPTFGKILPFPKKISTQMETELPKPSPDSI